ncbi:MAG: tRNA 2-thiouridine(34) synthase MnmA [Actinobacteria bacterium]|nr:tRNA 2-thiouridine(34) synthase MnmA [Actinomycetota bacterium]
MTRVLVAMSGGVDSSVAAALLLERGHDVVGMTLKLWGGPSDSGCCSVSDVEDARRVAAQLGIPHYVLNLTGEFERDVVSPYVDAYAAGRTPNPCVECNRHVKFGLLLDRAHDMGFDAVATGHHARVVHTAWGPHVARGADAAKDQSYVLYMLGPEVLGRVMLPVGEVDKASVRELARDLGLRTATKPESMDVCFITRDGREQFISERAEMVPGTIRDVSGQVVGNHRGVSRFTVGQRRRLGVAAGDRRYVVDVDAGTATVTIGGRDDLLRERVGLDGLVFHDACVPDVLDVQVRAHGEPLRGRLRGSTVCFDEPQPRVAPGQVVALYDGDVVVGGGIAR